MVRAGLAYLAAADAAQLSAATQAECLRELEQDAAVATAARASVLSSFTAGQGYAGDADYSAVSWLMHRTGITRGAAVGHTAWAKRVRPRTPVLAALAARQVSSRSGCGSACGPARLPGQHRDEAGREGGHGGGGGSGGGGAGRAVGGDVRAGPRSSCPMRTRTGTSPTAA